MSCMNEDLETSLYLNMNPVTNDEDLADAERRAWAKEAQDIMDEYKED